MIEAITGLPGAGKTLKAIQEGMAFRAKGRRVFLGGFSWVDTDATGFEVFDGEFKEWQEKLPEGAVLIWDEAQEVLPNRAIGAAVPKYIEALARHRHHGLDFVLITQEPRNLDSFVRRLIARHRHLVNAYGLQRAAIHEWQELQEEPKKCRAKALLTSWPYPKELYPLYRSATLHTKERRFPKRIFWAIGALILCIAAVFGVFAWMLGSHTAEVPEVADKRARKASSGASWFGGSGESSRRAPMTAQEYVASTVPRIRAQPWTAPMFDSRKPRAEPEVYCISSEDAKCICHTEQGTRYAMEMRECLTISLNGTYNPFRAPIKASRQADNRTGGNERLARADLRGQTEDRPLPRVRERPTEPPQTFPELEFQADAVDSDE